MSKIRKAQAVIVDDRTTLFVPATDLSPQGPQDTHFRESDGKTTALRDEASIAVEMERRVTEIQEACEIRLEEARKMAEEIVARANQEAERIRNDAFLQAREEGYATGYQEGLSACQSTCDGLVKKAQDVVRAAADHRMDLLDSMVEPITQLTVESVTVLLQRELILAPANVEQIVRDLFHFVMESNSVEVRVHPDDFITATAAHSKWMTAKFGEWDVAIVPDPGVAQGGCEILSESGRIDAQINTRLELLQEHLARIVNEEVIHRVG